MLVCGKCYGSQADLELSRILKQAKIIVDDEFSYDMALSRIIAMVHTNVKSNVGDRS